MINIEAQQFLPRISPLVFRVFYFIIIIFFLINETESWFNKLSIRLNEELNNPFFSYIF